MTVLYIGNHTSSSKGYAAMARQIIKNGGNTFAFFTRNPRGGKAKAIDETDIQNFLVLAQENHFGKIVAHAPYTLNACAAKEELRTFARETFADDLRRMEYTPGNYYNFHPGSHVAFCSAFLSTGYLHNIWKTASSACRMYAFYLFCNKPSSGILVYPQESISADLPLSEEKCSDCFFHKKFCSQYPGQYESL